MNRQNSLPSLHSRESSTMSLHRKTKMKTNIMSRLGYDERRWFETRKKTESIIFTSDQLNKLRQYFNDLDLDGSGSIGLTELEEPLITLEFCQSRKQVKSLIETIDLDGSGEVQFGEFLQIFRKFKLNKYHNSKQAQKHHTFMEMFNGNSSNYFGKEKSYKLALSQLRRKKMIAELTSPQVIKPTQKRYQRKRQIRPNFLRKVQSQFMQIPELNSILTEYKTKDYYRVKLGKP